METEGRTEEEKAKERRGNLCSKSKREKLVKKT